MKPKRIASNLNKVPVLKKSDSTLSASKNLTIMIIAKSIITFLMRLFLPKKIKIRGKNK